jgi:SET domain-containing protein
MAKRFVPGAYTLKVRRSKTGRGLYTLEPIPKNACIVEYIGRPVSEAEADRDQGKYLFEVGKGKTIDGNIKENIARYINHSCRPNCEADGPPGKVFIIARRAIKAGEELSYDYGTEYFDRHIKPKGCRCPKCALL